MKKLIKQYQPSALVIENSAGDDSRRSARIRSLGKRILVVAAKARIKAVVLSREEVKKTFFADGLGTKDDLAVAVADSFPDDLGHLLPPKRKLWIGEHYRLAMFEAVAVGLTFFRRSAKSSVAPDF